MNNQNYSIGDKAVSFPVMAEAKVQRLTVPARITEREQSLLASGKLGLLKVVEKSGKWYVHISVSVQTEQLSGDVSMGIDLGLKVPAVIVTSSISSSQ